MQRKLRARVKKIAAQLLIGLLIVSMAAFGLDAFFYGQPDGYGEGSSALTINGHVVTQNEVENAVSNYRQQVASRYGQESISQIPSSAINEGAINALIRETLVAQKTEGYGFTSSDNRVETEIANTDIFRSESGFDKVAFVNYLQTNNISAAQLSENIRRSISLQTLPNFVSQAHFTTQSEKNILSGIIFESRDVQYSSLNVHDFTTSVTPSDEDYQTHYEENSALYQSQEQASFAYILLDKQSFFSQVAEPDEDTIQLAYQARLTELPEDNRYDISHILVGTDTRSEEEAKTRAEEVLNLINTGSVFEDLAQEYSDDPGSASKQGSLGRISLDDFLPEFSDQVKLMSIGEIAGPVATDFGYHIIRLNQEPGADIPTLDSLRVELIEEIKNQEADNAYNQKKDELGNATYSATELQAPATELGLSVEVSGFFPRSGSADTNALFSNSALLQEAFGKDVLSDGLNSQVIDIDDKAIVIRLQEHQPARPFTFDEVASQVKTNVVQQQAQKKLEQVAQSIQQAATKEADSQGKTLAQVLNDTDFLLDIEESLLPKGVTLQWTVEKGAQRVSADIDREVLDLAFSLHETGVLDQQQVGSNMYLMVLTDSRQPQFTELNAKEQQQINEQIRQSEGNKSTSALFAYLEDSANIRRPEATDGSTGQP